VHASTSLKFKVPHVQLRMRRKLQVEKKWSGQGLAGLGGCAGPALYIPHGLSTSIQMDWNSYTWMARCWLPWSC